MMNLFKKKETAKEGNCNEVWGLINDFFTETYGEYYEIFSHSITIYNTREITYFLVYCTKAHNYVTRHSKSFDVNLTLTKQYTKEDIAYELHSANRKIEELIEEIKIELTENDETLIKPEEAYEIANEYHKQLEQHVKEISEPYLEWLEARRGN